MNNFRIVGGNRLQHLDLNQCGRQDLADGPYVYYYYKANADELIHIEDLGSFSIFVLNTGESLSISYLEVKKLELEHSCTVQAEDTSVQIHAIQSVIFLVAGTYKSYDILKTGQLSKKYFGTF